MDYVFVGDSNTQGNEMNYTGIGGPNNTSYRWSTVHASAMGGTETNNAQSGSVLNNDWGTSGHVLEDSISTLVPAYNGAVHGRIFVNYGINDFRRGHVSPYSLSDDAWLAVWIPKLEDCIDYIHATKGWPLLKITVCWNFIEQDVGDWGITKASWEYVQTPIRSATLGKGAAFLSFHDVIDQRGDKNDYSLSAFNGGRDYIHARETGSQWMADAAVSNIETPFKIKHGRLA